MAEAPESASLPSTGGGGESIAKILKASGPVIKCVLLKHMRKTGKDVKPHVPMSNAEAEAITADLHLPSGNKKNNSAKKDDADKGSQATTPPPSPRVKHSREVLTELIEEIEMDATPSKNGAQSILGGPFTFVGQYPDQGIVLMSRADQLEDLTSIEKLSVKELLKICKDSPDIDHNETMLEKSDLVAAVRDAQLPVNPHKLQPPFNKVIVRGDILIIKVADVDEEEQEENAQDQETATAKAIADFTKMSAVSNEEFFLDYTRDEYIAFASRTDIVAPKVEYPSSGEESEEEEEEEEDEDQEESDENEDDDDEYQAEDLDEEEDRRALLNLILGEVLKKFRQENGRGPDSEELLELRRQVAAKLGLKLEEQPTVSDDDDDKKRAAASSGSSPQQQKKVKFTPEVAAKADEDEKPGDGEGDKKPKAST